MTKAKAQPNTPAQKYPLGHAKENKDASTWSFKFPQSSGTNNDIGVYAQPAPNTNSAKITKDGNQVDSLRISVGGISKSQRSEKTDGITMRGYGAATKGIKSRGPMA